MNAREEILDLVGKILPPEHAKQYQGIVGRRLDAFAHELAEKQRSWAETFGNVPTARALKFVVNEAADLIDPGVTG